jgi:CBS domain-containing protein
MDDNDIENPYGHVEDVMTEWGLQTTFPDATLTSCVGAFDRVTGLPVIDKETGQVIGMFTRKASHC